MILLEKNIKRVRCNCLRLARAKVFLRVFLAFILPVTGSLTDGASAEDLNSLKVNGNGQIHNFDLKTFNRITFDNEGVIFSNRDDENVDVMKILYDNIQSFTFGEVDQTTGFDDFTIIDETKELIYNPETRTLTIGAIAKEGAVGVYTIDGTPAIMKKVDAGSVVALDGLAPGVYIIFLADTTNCSPKTLKIKI